MINLPEAVHWWYQYNPGKTIFPYLYTTHQTVFTPKTNTMSFAIAVIIMLLTGIAGGAVNYLLPANWDAEKKAIRRWGHCVMLGIGATILVPIFLELAQSKLLDDMRMGYSWQAKPAPDSVKAKAAAPAVTPKPATPAAKPADTTKTGKADSGKPADNSKMAATKPDSAAKPAAATASVTAKEDVPPMKHYLLFAAYCFLAAAAGIRFINNITDGVLKDRQLATQREQLTEAQKDAAAAKEKEEAAQKAKAEAEAQKAEAEKKKKLLEAQNRVNLAEAEKEMAGSMHIAKSRSLFSIAETKPVIGKITVPNDPQKNRFGGEREVKNRRLSATVEPSDIPGFYDVAVWVEALNGEQLESPVIFYLHDSFSNPVRTVEKNEFTDGKAGVLLKAWGAFTVGAVCENGTVLLEYDLSADKQFPEAFRSL